MLDIHDLMDRLAAKRPVFHSEADFQHALAWQIKETTGLDVRLEFPPFPGKPMRLDVWVRDLGTAIELKYPTRKLELECQGELFALSDGANDIDSYDFLKDLMRLERVTMEARRARTGIAVLLTNEWLHWRPPKLPDKTIGAEFRLFAGRSPPERMCWSPRAGPGSTAGRDAPIVLSGRYEFRWRNYRLRRSATEPKSAQFQYLAIEVRRPG